MERGLLSDASLTDAFLADLQTEIEDETVCCQRRFDPRCTSQPPMFAPPQVLRQSMLPIATRSDTFASQDSLLRILLSVITTNISRAPVPSRLFRFQMRGLQEQIIQILVEKLPEFMHDAPDVMEGASSGRDCIAMLLLNFSWREETATISTSPAAKFLSNV